MAVVTSMVAPRYRCLRCGKVAGESRISLRLRVPLKTKKRCDRPKSGPLGTRCGGDVVLEIEHRLYVNGRWGRTDGDHIHMEICSEAASWHWRGSKDAAA